MVGSQTDLGSGASVRVSDGDRERVGSVLNLACQQGYLSIETFSHRIDRAFESKTTGELDALLSDLPTVGERFAQLKCAWRRLTKPLDRTDGPPAPTLISPAWSMTQVEFLIGRDPACDISFGDSAISRRHARLTRMGRAWVLSDLDSLNGTYVNGRPITTATVLARHDQLRFGETVTVFERPTPPT
jgi:hypothetical protein